MGSEPAATDGRVRYVTLVWWQEKDNGSLEWAAHPGPRRDQKCLPVQRVGCRLFPAQRSIEGESQAQNFSFAMLHGVSRRCVKDPEQPTAE